MNTIFTIAGPTYRRPPFFKNVPNRLWSAAGIHRARIATLIVEWMIMVLWPAAARAQSYTATLVQSTDLSFPPSSLNDRGEVAGHYSPGEGTAKPAVWRDGTLVELPLLPGASGGFASGLNNLGQIVGSCFTRAAGIGHHLPSVHLGRRSGDANRARSKTNYSYFVTAVNSIGLESPASNAVSARPK